MNFTDYINFIPVMRVCSGQVTNKVKNTEMWEVKITQSSIGSFNGPIYCKATHPPGCDYNIKKGDYVKVLMTFMWGGPYNRYCDLSQNSECLIIGSYNERYIIPGVIENKNSKNTEDVIRFVNKESGAGLLASDNGCVTLATGGTIAKVMKPWGYGIYKNSEMTVAQNHYRVVAYNSPFYLSREGFGLYSGADQNDEASKLTASDLYINYRRFVQQTADIDNWVSTCEGFWAPWVGANNNATTMAKSRPPIYTKIINKEGSRVTVESGDSVDKFVNIRVDDVIVGERTTNDAVGAATAKLGNRFNLEISSEGALKMDVAGAGNNGPNTYGVRIVVNTKGELSIFSKGKMTFSHSENDLENNSIVMDPQAGIDLQAIKGVRVNGQTIVLQKFIEWMDQNKAQLCQVTAIGGPAPIHPTAQPGFVAGLQKNALQDGFTSKGAGANASGNIQATDNFNSV